MKLISATANQHKYKEMQQILSGKIELLPPPEIPEIIEDAPDLQGNAHLKAQGIMEATGKPAIADDTGLEVEALNGEPGVLSARYTQSSCRTRGQHQKKLLSELSDVPMVQRGARFRTVIVVLWPDETFITAQGIVSGKIALSPAGTLGFGYDSIFLPSEIPGKTFGEISDSEKESNKSQRPSAKTNR